MSLHRYFSSPEAARAFAASTKGKVVRYKDQWEVEFSPSENEKTLREVHNEVRAERVEAKVRRIEYAQKQRARRDLDGSRSTYTRGISCGRGNHVWVSQPTYLKCSKCGSSRSLTSRVPS